VRGTYSPAVKIIWAFACLVALGFLAGCGGGKSASESAPVPPPPIERDLPKGYRVLKTFDANLTGGPVPETVVASVGPPTGRPEGIKLQPATVQVLSWDPERKGWAVVFDAQKTVAPATYGDPRTSNGGPAALAGVEEDPTPILDPEADVALDLVDAARLLTDKREELVLSAALNYGGSGVPQILAVVDFGQSKAKVLYAWRGEHLEPKLDDDRIVATSSYWTRADSHCCPSRDYRFVVGPAGDRITELEDDRPYLGVLVRERGKYFGEGPLQVLEVAKGSPAEGKLRAGDVLLDVENAPPPQTTYGGEPRGFYSKLAAFEEGDTARIVIERDGSKTTVPVRLASLKDAATMSIPEGEERVDGI
jgi:hypothetical protein